MNMTGGGGGITDLFNGRCILVTGASGFLGKVLVEKLLWSISEIGTVYLLIRPQNGLDPKQVPTVIRELFITDQRLDKILSAEIFDRLRRYHPDRFNRLVPVAGNLMEAELGLSQPDRHRLCDDVSIVLHCAATVKFDEALRISVEMNVLGTQRLIALCHKMRQLISVVHASTAYANCDRTSTVEAVYPPPVHPTKLVDALEWMSDDMVRTLTPLMLAQRPNTYTLTKALAEVQLVEDSGQLPVAIVRPSIIGAMWKEPIPGWTDNLNGPTGIFAGVGKGLLTNMCGNGDSIADIIPVDIVSNLIIAVAWYRAVTKLDEIPVIHCSSGVLNPMKWGKIVNYSEVFFRKYPVNQCYRVPSTYFHASRVLFELNFNVKHLLPAYILDFLARMSGRKPQFVRIYGKLMKMMETLHYFTTRGWQFESKNLITVWDHMSSSDRQEFNFDIRQLDWDFYLFDYLMGTKRYLLKEKLDDLPIARRNLSRVQMLGHVLNAGSWALIVQLFARKRTRREKWTIWLTGFLFTHIWQNVNLRPAVRLRTLEQYKTVIDDAQSKA